MENKREGASIVPLPESPAIDVRANAQHFDAFIRHQLRGLVQFLRARTASEQDAEDAAHDQAAPLSRIGTADGLEAIALPDCRERGA
jgi:hypothetical protein